MWIKSIKELEQFFTEDGKYHDIQIINLDLYIDGKLVHTQRGGKMIIGGCISNVRTDNKVKSKEQIEKEFKEQDD